MKKLCVALLIIVSVQAELPDEDRKKIVDNHKQCLTKVGIDKDVIKNAESGDAKDGAKFRDYIFCANKLNGFQDDKGDFQKENSLKVLTKILDDKEAAEKLYESCAVKKDTPEVTAYEAFLCYKKNSPKPLGLL